MRKNNKKKPIINALEQRILFDGAAVATAVDVLDNSSFSSTSNDSTTTNDVTNNNAENSVHDAQAVQSFERPRKEIAFVDTTVEDYLTLVDGIGEGVETYLVSSMNEINDILKNLSDVDSIHILSHGTTGEIIVGNDVLNSDNLNTYEEVLESIKNSLTEEGDLLLYGCNVASNGEGQEFIDTLATITSADVAASNDITGSSELGGDWDLEVSSGIIDTDEIQIDAFEGELAGLETDTDGDNVIDENDIDDDNDGILDIYESKENFQWVSNYSTISGNIATGSIGGINFTYTLDNISSSNPDTISTSAGMYNFSNFPSSYNLVDTNPAIANYYVSSNTLTFDSTILNPTLAFGSVGNVGAAVGITFSDDVEIVWQQDTDKTTGTTLTAGSVITGREGYLIVKFIGEYTTISFNYTSDESYANFTFGADVRQDVDTDNDGIFDRLDTDSDNDGVLDNVEAQVIGGFGISDPTTLAGYIAPLGKDVDMDGLDDAYDADTSSASKTLASVSNGLTPIDSNSNGTADYLVDEAPVLTVGTLASHDGTTTSSEIIAPALTLVDVENHNISEAKIQKQKR